MFTPYIFDLLWQSIAIAVYAVILGLLCRLCAMQPVAQVAKVCSGCRRVARDGDEEHGAVTLKLVVMEGGQRG